MLRPPHAIALADLAAAGVPLRASDAATIAREVALRAARGDLPGIPSHHVIRLTEDGAIHVEGPIASGREIERAARLLEALLPPFDSHGSVRVPGGVRLVIARALRLLDLPPFPSLEAYADALRRFASGDPSIVVRDLVATWRAVTDPAEVDPPDAVGVVEGTAPPAAAEPAELTISDIRRARRATRLTLVDLAERTRIPADRLRELEWGYFAHWPAGLEGRTHLVCYARAAGLDERIVLRVVLPMLDEWRTLPADPALTVEGSVVSVHEPGALVKREPAPLRAPPLRVRRRAGWLAAAAILALLTIASIPALWMGDENESAVPAPARPAATVQLADAKVTEDVVSAANAAFSPAFATVGSAVFYHTGRGERSAILKADADESGALLRVTRVIDDEASNFHARPSPDGSLIAFDSDREGTRAVYVADADGRNVRRVSGEGFAAVPGWSPDGRRLAFVRAERGRPRVWNIWMLDLESGEQTRITSHTVGQPWGAAWFPDGQHIAYSHETRLVVRALHDAGARTFDSPVRGRLVRTPAVSPDGRFVIFQVHRDGGWLLDLATARMRKVLDDPSAEEFTWSPDGRRLAFHSREKGQWAVRILDAPSVGGDRP
jgi:Tol biopolymer transport system component